MHCLLLMIEGKIIAQIYPLALGWFKLPLCGLSPSAELIESKMNLFPVTEAVFNERHILSYCQQCLYHPRDQHLLTNDITSSC